MKKSLVTISLAVMITSAAFSANVFSAQPPQINSKPMLSVASMLKPIMPAVVNIAAQGEMWLPKTPKLSPPSADDDQDKETGGPYGPYGALREFASLGSGVIINSQKGYILTNAHVINKARTITVTLNDGRHFKAKLIGADTATDIAVLQIPPQQLTAMPLGNSENLNVGDFVAAIGNPFGLNQTVTSGIISALGRASLGIEGAQGVENFIQTDASINPGNSGGALINMQGQLIGINTAILTPAGGNIGIGFAIPINMARTIMAQLIEYGSVKRGLMGVIVQDLTPDLATAFGVNNSEGALISQISPDSPAAQAGLQAGDIIQQVNDIKINDASQVRNAIGVLRVGSTIHLQILRHGKTISLKLITADPEKYIDEARNQNPFLFGLALRNFDQETPLRGHVRGVQVLYISKNSIAWRAGILPGDVILSANQQTVTSIDQLEKIARENHKHLLINIMRHNDALFVVLNP